MATDLWMNLPVQNVEKSKAFFTQIGFAAKTIGDGVQVAIGAQGTKVMLFPSSKFETFTHHRVADSMKATEVLFSIGAEDREEVDAMIKNVEKAGGAIYAKPGLTDGWLYGAGFIDLDGHRWNVLYMDMEKMP
ncbi:extradiol dioxygenase [Alkalihalobacillus hwajinpoensis]|uniref:VOC family protein n=1 Tax=Guptibacillus hwajinpoensis TaxID=208199 RepID=UPI0018843CE5|nr:VOC family protein [Pseudalkalibacillus hwajinpoensis]MBF0707441.1 extradiol dioxygenase [Pseudalkalibacillus hwajinpoensis]